MSTRHWIKELSQVEVDELISIHNPNAGYVNTEVLNGPIGPMVRTYSNSTKMNYYCGGSKAEWREEHVFRKLYPDWKEDGYGMVDPEFSLEEIGLAQSLMEG